MVAKYRCDQIAKETLSRLRKDVQACPAPKIRESIKSILENTLSQYDKEAIHFKESIRDDKRKWLETEALQVLHPDFAAMLQHLRSSAINKEVSGDGFEAAEKTQKELIKARKIKKRISKGAGLLMGIGAGMAMIAFGCDPFSATAGALAASASTKRLIDKIM